MADRIIVLSLSDRVAPYQEALASFELEVEYLDNVMEVFRSCVRRPPGALIVDMVSASVLESSALVNLTNLNLGWPIVRCRARPDGILMLVSTSPINRGAIGEALPKLLERDANWVNVNNVRMDLRVPVEARGRCRIGDGEWVLGNVLNLGTGGCFFHCYATVSVDSEIEVELRDLGREPLVFSGRVSWTSLWEFSPRLPGFGVKFARSPETDKLVEYIVKSPRLKNAT